MKRPKIEEKKVLVTGCSSGIGLATARVLRARGWQVVPTARKDEDLAMLRADGFTPVRLDVADEKSVSAAAAEALKFFDGKIGALVNNAGFGQAGAVEDLTRDTLVYQMNVNFIGAHDLTTRFIPVMRRQGWGRIVNVSSVLGKIVNPMYGSYSASKYAMEALSDAMRVELWTSGIGVILIEPGPIVSEFRRNAAEHAQSSLDLKNAVFGGYYEKEIQRRIRQQKKPDLFTLAPEAVAEKILHALESPSPKRRYRVTIPAYLGTWAARFVPDCILDWARTRKLPRTA
jgi:NAD(P)-dependent dehydrogenase (short-subunit alcohol dehydrogenase family)